MSNYFKKVSTLTSFIALLGVANVAFAADQLQDLKDGKLYLDLKYGNGHNTKLKGDFNEKIKKADTISVNVGRYLNDQFSTGLSYSSNLKKLKYDHPVKHLSADYNVRSNLRYSVFTANTYIYPRYDIGILRPYVGAGAGLAVNKLADIKYINSSAETVAVKKGSTTKNFAWNLMAGSLFNINENFALNLEYKYSDLGRVKSGRNLSMITGKQVDSARLKSRLHLHNVMFGVRYEF